jgi:hypothetical protein
MFNAVPNSFSSEVKNYQQGIINEELNAPPFTFSILYFTFYIPCVYPTGLGNLDS